MNKDILHITLMLEAISDIERYVGGFDEDRFQRDEILKNACLMKLVVFGENGGKVSVELKNKFNDVEWQQIKAARNFFVHEYEKVEWPRVWMTINEILPGIKTKLEKVIKSLND